MVFVWRRCCRSQRWLARCSPTVYRAANLSDSPLLWKTRSKRNGAKKLRREQAFLKANSGDVWDELDIRQWLCWCQRWLRRCYACTARGHDERVWEIEEKRGQSEPHANWTRRAQSTSSAGIQFIKLISESTHHSWPQEKVQGVRHLSFLMQQVWRWYHGFACLTLSKARLWKRK